VQLYKWIQIGACAGLVLAGSSCKVQQPLRLPSAKEVPSTFAQQTDTASIGSIPLKVFFKDPPLQQLIDSALQHNFDLQIALQRINTARAALVAAKHAWLPSLDISASAGVDKYADYTLNGVGNFDTNLSPNIDKNQRIPTPTPEYFLGLRSSWEIDLWGKLKQRKKAAYARLLASEKGRQLVTTLLVSQVASMYYELIALDNELSIIHKNIALQQKAVATIQIQKAGGRATELAVQQFTAQLLSTQSMAYNIRQQIVHTESQLNRLLGRFQQPIVRTGNIFEQPLPVDIKTGIPAAMLLHRPDIQQAELELMAAKSDVQAARKAFLPSLNITPYAGFNAFNASLLFQSPSSIAYGIVGGLTAPIFNKQLLNTQYKQAGAAAIASFYEYQKTIVNSFQEVITALNQVDNQQAINKLKEQEVTVLQQAVATSQDLYMAGYANYLEVITAQKSVLEAELALTMTRKQIFQGTIELYRALEGGWK
jgi:multidrug efflux system outer membrane protein